MFSHSSLHGKQMGKWNQRQTLFSCAPKSLWTVTIAMKLRQLLTGRKTMINLDSILKTKESTLPTKVHIVQVMVFPVVIYCESWIVKKAECQRIDAFRLWWWRPLRVLWTARRSNQSILKEINPEYSLEGLMLKLKFQYSGRLMQRADSAEKTDAGKDWSKRRRVWQRMRWLDSITDSMDMLLLLSRFSHIRLCATP